MVNFTRPSSNPEKENGMTKSSGPPFSCSGISGLARLIPYHSTRERMFVFPSSTVPSFLITGQVPLMKSFPWYIVQVPSTELPE
ncbi:MAG: hypothetical protein A4E40_01100 [Methanoregulaceae archaeon PtaU1.Bin059]|nr:MAG: hypothetical protein A4E40_01100 [Methanoregulaceae archaeon PtaU1.Bin059]